MFAKNHKPVNLDIEVKWNGVWKGRLTDFDKLSKSSSTSSGRLYTGIIKEKYIFLKAVLIIQYKCNILTKITFNQ